VSVQGPATSGVEQTVEDVPVAGSTVSLLSSSGDVMSLAELVSWSTGPAGLTAIAVLATTRETAEMLDGHRVWASLFTEVTNTLLVVQGVVRRSRADRPAELVLTGMTGIAREPRRVEPRAPLSRPVRLAVQPSAEPVRGRTVDLSPSGCRLELDDDESLVVGEVVTVEVDLEEGSVLRAAGRVSRLSRVDDRRRQPVLRFLGLTRAEEVAISRCVYSALSTGSAAGGSPAA
jgi:hypothetical protein